jgi:hypothetical protein
MLHDRNIEVRVQQTGIDGHLLGDESGRVGGYRLSFFFRQTVREFHIQLDKNMDAGALCYALDSLSIFIRDKGIVTNDMFSRLKGLYIASVELLNCMEKDGYLALGPKEVQSFYSVFKSINPEQFGFGGVDPKRREVIWPGC